MTFLTPTRTGIRVPSPDPKQFQHDRFINSECDRTGRAACGLSAWRIFCSPFAPAQMLFHRAACSSVNGVEIRHTLFTNFFWFECKETGLPATISQNDLNGRVTTGIDLPPLAQ